MLLETAPVLRRFGLTEDDLPLLHDMVADLNVHWGLDGEMRGGTDQLFTWKQAVERMILGWMLPEGGNPMWQDVSAWYADVNQTALFGRFAALLETLSDIVRIWRQPAIGEGRLKIVKLKPMTKSQSKTLKTNGSNGRRKQIRHIPKGSRRIRPDCQPRQGRARRDDDRYLFLEALISAREILYLSYIGRDIRKDEELAPSSLLGELIDTVAAMAGIGAATCTKLDRTIPASLLAPIFSRRRVRRHIRHAYRLRHCARTTPDRRG
ncbi:exodeoxyribonuclease V, gamma subunit [Neisseria meningitidis 2005040]|nr:exodeoxyribonuclease V, gamma subunit [Neisseria meningitidis 2005040]